MVVVSPKLSRRDFLKLAAVTGTAVAVAATISKEQFIFGKVFKEGAKLEAAAGDVVAFTTCYGCLGRCNVQVTISPNKLPRYIAGSIYTRNEGGMCAIGASAMLHYLSPARLRSPLLRVPTSERCKGDFIEITYNDMLDILVNGDNAALLKERGWTYGFKGMKEINQCCPERFAYFTGRDQYNPAENTWFAAMFGSPNQGGHGGFCATNVASGGSYILGGTWWEYGGWDSRYVKLLILSGVTQDHFPTIIRREITKVKERGGEIIYMSPERIGNFGQVADEWLPVVPGTDGAVVWSIIQLLLTAWKNGVKAIDEEYLKWYTNAPWLVITNPDGSIDPPQAPNTGLFLRVKNRNGDWVPAVVGSDGNIYPFTDVPWQNGVSPVLEYRGTVTVPKGPDAAETVTVNVKTAFMFIEEEAMKPDYAPENVEAKWGAPPAYKVRELAQKIVDLLNNGRVVVPAKWTDYLGRQHDYFIGTPFSVYIMRGISAHTNGFQTARAFAALLALVGAVDTPGGWMYKPPAPWPIPDGDYWPPYITPPDPRMRVTADDYAANPSLFTGPNGEKLVGVIGGTMITERILNDGTVQVTHVYKVPYPKAIQVTTKIINYTPDNVVVDDKGHPLLIDRAFSWEFPFALHRIWTAVNIDAGLEWPYRLEFLLWHITNPYWDNAYDIDKDLGLLLAKDSDGRYRIPFVAIVDTFYGGSVPCVDLAIPDTTFFERYGEHSLLDRPTSATYGPADNIEWPILPPLFKEVIPWSDGEILLGEKLGLPGFLDQNGNPMYPNKMYDWLWKFQYAPGVGVLYMARGKGGTSCCKGEPNPDQIKMYVYPGFIPAANYSGQKTYPPPQKVPVLNGKYPPGVNPGTQTVGHAFGYYELPLEIRYFRHVNKGYLEWAASVGMMPYAKPVIIQLYSEIIQKYKLAAYGLWKGYNAYYYYMYEKTGDSKYLDLARKNASPPSDWWGSHVADIIKKYYNPIPAWYPPLDWLTPDGSPPDQYPIATINRKTTPWFYHTWENHHPWLRQIIPYSVVWMNPKTAAAYGIKDGDWVEFTSRGGEVARGQVKLTEAVAPGVVGYWKSRNARAGAFGIPPNSLEVTKGFMFNDIYVYTRAESLGGVPNSQYTVEGLLTAVGQGNYPTLNLDPFSGKTAWGDLRVKIVRIANDKPESAWGNADKILKTPPKLIVGEEAWSIGVFNYNAYKQPSDMGIGWYEVNSSWYKFQQTVEGAMGYQFESALQPRKGKNASGE
jgi:anaerobic selenocysteine-containing dehydrogenase